MAGHSKWANIQYRKRGQDAKRGKLFTKIIREITVAARAGGADPANNPRLRAVWDKALGANMNKDTIERAIARGVGDLDGNQLDEIRYEGYGPFGVAVMVDCMTDNRNRTVAEVRHAFSKGGGNLGTSGSVAYLFNAQGEICFDPSCDEEQLLDLALGLGAEDVSFNPEGPVVITNKDTYAVIQQGLTEQGFEPTRAECTMVASTLVSIDDAEDAEKLMKLVDRLEDLDDVQEVYTNADFSDSVMQSLGDA